jgi:hypothetical protein
VPCYAVVDAMTTIGTLTLGIMPGAMFRLLLPR